VGGSALLAILALAAVLAVNNFFGAVSLGATSLGPRRRWAVVGLFALADGVLPLVGVVLGAGLARALGPAASFLGIGLIMATGVYLAWGAVRPRREAAAEEGRWGPLLVSALALGLDNLGAALGLGATGVDVPLTLLTFAVVTGLVTGLGVWIGGLLRRGLPGRHASGVAGVLLFGTGCTMLAARLHGGS
jgi:putative Mn2+ efflux pump MntP